MRLTFDDDFPHITRQAEPAVASSLWAGGPTLTLILILTPLTLALVAALIRYGGDSSWQFDGQLLRDWFKRHRR